MRMVWMRRIALAAVLMAVTAAGALAQTTVVLVRHAEKMDDSADPVLSEAGTARAQRLAEALAHAGVSAIVTTQYQRTRLTAAPLADATGIATTVVAASGRSHAQDVAQRVRELAGDGRTILVVGHSNTVPAIIQALGGPDVGMIPDAEYDNLFVLTLSDSGARLIRGRF